MKPQFRQLIFSRDKPNERQQLLLDHNFISINNIKQTEEDNNNRLLLMIKYIHTVLKVDFDPPNSIINIINTHQHNCYSQLLCEINLNSKFIDLITKLPSSTNQKKSDVDEYYFNVLYNNNSNVLDMIKIAMLPNKQLTNKQNEKFDLICKQNNLSKHLIKNSKNPFLLKKLLYFDEFEKFDYIGALKNNFIIINDLLFFKPYQEWKMCDGLNYKSFFVKEKHFINFENFIRYLEKSKYGRYDNHRIIIVLKFNFNNNIKNFLSDLGFGENEYLYYQNLFNEKLEYY